MSKYYWLAFDVYCSFNYSSKKNQHRIIGKSFLKALHHGLEFTQNITVQHFLLLLEVKHTIFTKLLII